MILIFIKLFKLISLVLEGGVVVHLWLMVLEVFFTKSLFLEFTVSQDALIGLDLVQSVQVIEVVGLDLLSFSENLLLLKNELL